MKLIKESVLSECAKKKLKNKYCNKSQCKSIKESIWNTDPDTDTCKHLSDEQLDRLYKEIYIGENEYVTDAYMLNGVLHVIIENNDMDVNDYIPDFSQDELDAVLGNVKEECTNNCDNKVSGSFSEISKESPRALKTFIKAERDANGKLSPEARRIDRRLGKNVKPYENKKDPLKEDKKRDYVSAEDAAKHVLNDKGKVTILGNNGYLGCDFFANKDGDIFCCNFEIGVCNQPKGFDILKHFNNLEKEGFKFVISDGVDNTRNLHINNTYRLESLKEEN